LRYAGGLDVARNDVGENDVAEDAP